MGKFPLPIEIIPAAVPHVFRKLKSMGGEPAVRYGVVTDNGNHIIDCAGLSFDDPETLEKAVNAIPGVLDNGVFAARKADMMMICDPEGQIEHYTINR